MPANIFKRDGEISQQFKMSILFRFKNYGTSSKKFINIMTYSRKRIRSKRSKMRSENALQYCDVYIFYSNFLNECVVVKNFCRYFVIYHNWKVPGENFLQQASPNCRFKLYVEHLNLCKVNNTTFCLFWFLYISYWIAKNNSFFILHQFDTANNTILSLIYFSSPPLCRLKTCSIFTC